MEGEKTKNQTPQTASERKRETERYREVDRKTKKGRKTENIFWQQKLNIERENAEDIVNETDEDSQKLILERQNFIRSILYNIYLYVIYL